MHITYILLAALGAFVAYMAMGTLMFVTLPMLKREFAKYPAVYRDHQGQMSHMPVGMAGIFLSMLVLAVLYAMIYPGGAGVAAGVGYGALIGVYALGSFVLHNHANLNVGWRLTLFSALAYFVEWCAVGVAISLIYRPT